MKRCTNCGRDQDLNALRCASCGNSAFYDLSYSRSFPPPRPPRAAELASSGMMRLLRLTIFACVLLVVTRVAWNTWQLFQMKQQLAQSRTELQRDHDLQVEQEQESLAASIEADETGYRTRLQEKEFASGTLAYERHAQEWEARLKHDPHMAGTPVETTLLRMEKLGRDPAVAAKAALEQVAQLAAPPQSRVEVLPNGDRFVVKVAFRMSALSTNEAGAVTKHHTTDSMKREILFAIAVEVLDLCGIESRHLEPRQENNFLYRNNGNSNRWLKVRLVGTVSNRTGIGAKVRVKAAIGGQDRWQLRQSASSDGRTGGNLEAHFGLGDATIIDTVRIEWPSGIVQELQGVSVKQHLTVTEPARLQVLGRGAFRVQSWKGMAFEVQASTDLKQWSPVTTVTNLTGTLEFMDSNAANDLRHFYRTVLR